MHLTNEIVEKLIEFKKTKSIPLATEICYDILASDEE